MFAKGNLEVVQEQLVMLCMKGRGSAQRLKGATSYIDTRSRGFSSACCTPCNYLSCGN